MSLTNTRISSKSYSRLSRSAAFSSLLRAKSTTGRRGNWPSLYREVLLGKFSAVALSDVILGYPETIGTNEAELTKSDPESGILMPDGFPIYQPT